MNKKPILVILSPGFPRDEQDTTCMPPQQVFVKAVKKFFPSLEIVVLSFHYPPFNAEYEIAGCRVISFGGKTMPVAGGWLLRYKIWKALKKIKKDNTIIGLLSFWCGECAFTGKWFAGKNKLKHFCWLLGQDAKKNNRWIKWIKPVSGELIALSDFIQTEFSKNHGITPEYVIPPGIDPDLFKDGMPVKEIDIIGAGSLIPLKQYEIFIEVISELKNKIPLIKAKLCGKGPEEKKLRNMIEKMNLAAAIELSGELSHPELLQTMKKAKILLHTSSYEGFGVVCIEGLHAGCHVISFTNPMNKHFPRWHIVKNKEEMSRKALELLMDSETSYEPVTPLLASDTARSIMKLYNFPEAVL